MLADIFSRCLLLMLRHLLMIFSPVSSPFLILMPLSIFFYFRHAATLLRAQRARSALMMLRHARHPFSF